MNTYKIALLEGDGIGPEIAREAVKVLQAIEQAGKAQFEITSAPFGGGAYFSHGHSFPEETKAVCDAADAIIKGPIGLSKAESDKIPSKSSPNAAHCCRCGDATIRLPTSAPSTCPRACSTFRRCGPR